MMASTRRLAAIMFTDMVGFTADAQADEQGALARLREQELLVRPVVSAFGGREVKSTGDGLLIEFGSALRATKCAIEIQGCLHERNARVESHPIELRIGIHLGDIEVQGTDVFGDAVNIAARVAPLAQPGGICVSVQVFDQVHDKISNRLEPQGRKTLKGIRAPMEVYQIVLVGSSGPGASRLPPARIAVIPFANISPNPSDEFFADGLTDEMIATISRVRDLSVISRTSVIQYKNRKISTREIGRELGVGSLLEGSVRKAGNLLRISAQLIDVEGDRPLWSDTYDREMKDVFSIQSEIAQQVAEALKLHLTPTSIPSPRLSSASTEAYTFYLKGRYFWNKATKEWLLESVDQFLQSIAKDPQYAPAYAGLADAYLLLGRRGDLSPNEAYPKAISNASIALGLDSSLAEPHAALGSIRQEHEWKWKESEAEFRHAIDLNPSYSTAHSWYGLFLGHVGRFDEAISQAQRAQELDPRYARVHAGAAEEYIFARKYDDALEAARRAVELDPSFGSGHAYIAEALVGKELYNEAIAEFEQAGKLLGAQAWMGRLGHAYAHAGRISDAKHVVETLQSDLTKTQSGNPFLTRAPYSSLDMGLVLMGLGNFGEALDWFEIARNEHVPEVVHFKCEPIYDPVQSEPRFRNLLKSVGFD
jgi:adenylate cyclase